MDSQQELQNFVLKAQLRGHEEDVRAPPRLHVLHNACAGSVLAQCMLACRVSPEPKHRASLDMPRLAGAWPMRLRARPAHKLSRQDGKAVARAVGDCLHGHQDLCASCLAMAKGRGVDGHSLACKLRARVGRGAHLGCCFFAQLSTTLQVGHTDYVGPVAYLPQGLSARLPKGAIVTGLLHILMAAATVCNAIHPAACR